MDGMPRLPTDKLLRLGAGMAVLLWAAAEENVCARLLQPPVRSADAAARRSADGAPDGQPAGGQKRAAREPLTISSVLPDAVPARWLGHAQRGARVEALGHRDGTVAEGPLHFTSHSSAEFSAGHGWPSWTPQCAFRAPTPPVTTCKSHMDPAVRTVLRRTGPPCARG